MSRMAAGGFSRLVVYCSRPFHVGTPRLILALFCACLAIARHGPNIRRLIAGTEPDFKAGKRRD